ncbi:ADP-ribosylglycohydrolase family protein [Prevotella sp.]|uniref:ADP-ribosylglycohydrolase family protein n=1 Tax=Prevotella sp. TaxID=59823 RepID=UPI0025CCB9A6|nr:ADP-ribosylglycohydrolase family protein [Prevotella sp.]
MTTLLHTSLYCPMLMGAILGDIAGSIYEFDPHKSMDINLQDKRMDFTDDTIMTIAVAEWILNDKWQTKNGLVERMQQWGHRYHKEEYVALLRIHSVITSTEVAMTYVRHTGLTAVAKVQYQNP